MCLQKTEVEVVYHTELHVSVDEYPERFLQSSVFYFSRNLRGEIYIPNEHIKAYISYAFVRSRVTFASNRGRCSTSGYERSCQHHVQAF